MWTSAGQCGGDGHAASAVSTALVSVATVGAGAVVPPGDPSGRELPVPGHQPVPRGQRAAVGVAAVDEHLERHPVTAAAARAPPARPRS